MPGSWKSDWLLNLVLVARVDGTLHPLEVLFLSRCRDRVVGSKLTLADAVMRSFLDGDLRPVNLITDEAVLRDMVRMAAMDGTTTASETNLIAKFLDIARIPRDRAEVVIREALAGMEHEYTLIHQDIDQRHLRPNPDRT